MKYIAAMFSLLVPGFLAAQTWSSCASPCLISAQISGTPPKLTLVDPKQAYVQVKVGAQIQWKVAAASYFLIVMDPKSVLFDKNGKTYYFSTSSPVGGTVTGKSASSAGDHYFIYAIDASGNMYPLDPKVRTNSGPLHPPSSGK